MKAKISVGWFVFGGLAWMLGGFLFAQPTGWQYIAQLMIGTVATPDNKLHVMESNASATSNANAVVTIEENADTGLQFLTPAANSSFIYFGDPGDDDAGYIEYDHSSDTLKIRHSGADSGINISSTGIGIIYTGTEAWALKSGYLEDSAEGNVFYLTETSYGDPGGPDANRVYIYAKDNGSGKTTLCAKFNTGAVQCFATEP